MKKHICSFLIFLGLLGSFSKASPHDKDNEGYIIQITTHTRHNLDSARVYLNSLGIDSVSEKYFLVFNRGNINGKPSIYFLFSTTAAIKSEGFPKEVKVFNNLLRPENDPRLKKR